MPEGLMESILRMVKTVSDTVALQQKAIESLGRRMDDLEGPSPSAGTDEAVWTAAALIDEACMGQVCPSIIKSGKDCEHERDPSNWCWLCMARGWLRKHQPASYPGPGAEPPHPTAWGPEARAKIEQYRKDTPDAGTATCDACGHEERAHVVGILTRPKPGCMLCDCAEFIPKAHDDVSVEVPDEQVATWYAIGEEALQNDVFWCPKCKTSHQVTSCPSDDVETDGPNCGCATVRLAAGVDGALLAGTWHRRGLPCYSATTGMTKNLPLSISEPCMCGPAQQTLGEHGKWCPVAVEQRAKATVSAEHAALKRVRDYITGSPNPDMAGVLALIQHEVHDSQEPDA